LILGRINLQAIKLFIVTLASNGVVVTIPLDLVLGSNIVSCNTAIESALFAA